MICPWYARYRVDLSSWETLLAWQNIIYLVQIVDIKVLIWLLAWYFIRILASYFILFSCSMFVFRGKVSLFNEFFCLLCHLVLFLFWLSTLTCHTTRSRTKCLATITNQRCIVYTHWADSNWALGEISCFYFLFTLFRWHCLNTNRSCWYFFCFNSRFLLYFILFLLYVNVFVCKMNLLLLSFRTPL